MGQLPIKELEQQLSDAEERTSDLHCKLTRTQEQLVHAQDDEQEARTRLYNASY